MEIQYTMHACMNAIIETYLPPHLLTVHPHMHSRDTHTLPFPPFVILRLGGPISLATRQVGKCPDLPES